MRESVTTTFWFKQKSGARWLYHTADRVLAGLAAYRCCPGRDWSREGTDAASIQKYSKCFRASSGLLWFRL